MIKYVLKQNKNQKSLAYNKWYAYPTVEETISLADLAEHMEKHNTGFSEGMCLGMMTVMVKCIKEMLLAGKNVKIDNLAIFSVGIRNKEGAASKGEFTVANNIAGVKLRARATGTLKNANLNSEASVKKATAILGNGGDDGGDDGNAGGGNAGGGNAGGGNAGGGNAGGGNAGGGNAGGGNAGGDGDGLADE